MLETRERSDNGSLVTLVRGKVCLRILWSCAHVIGVANAPRKGHSPTNPTYPKSHTPHEEKHHVGGGNPAGPHCSRVLIPPLLPCFATQPKNPVILDGLTVSRALRAQPRPPQGVIGTGHAGMSGPDPDLLLTQWVLRPHPSGRVGTGNQCPKGGPRVCPVGYMPRWVGHRPVPEGI